MPRQNMIKVRRDTSTNWNSVNPVLADGEIAYDKTCESIIIGDGIKTFLENMKGSATSTIRVQSIYVDKAATGTGTGVDWTNAFTTIQAAVDSLPAIINHAVTIYIRKGSTAYDEVITLQRVVADGSVTIRGEYYWTGTVSTGGTGKFTLNSSDPHYADRAQIAAGDKVILMAYSSAVEGYNVPTASYIDTVASVSGAEVTLTTNTTLATTTLFTYQIIKTQIQCTTASTYTLVIRYTNAVYLYGLYIGHSSYRSMSLYSVNLTAYSCYFNGRCVPSYLSNMTAFRSYFTEGGETNGDATAINTESVFYTHFCIFGASRNGFFIANNSIGYIKSCHIKNTISVGLSAVGMSYILITAILNEATTPLNPASNPGTDGAYII